MVAASAERMEIKKHEEAAYFGEVPMVGKPWENVVLIWFIRDDHGIILGYEWILVDIPPGYPLVMSK